MPRAVWLIAIVFLLAAGLLTGVVLVIRSHNEALRRQTLGELLTRADEQISLGSYQAALPYLERAMRSAATRDSWLAIAKRAYSIAQVTGNYSFLLRVATKGTENLPGSQQLWAIKVLAQSRGGDPAAGETTARRRLTDLRYQSFGTEAVLRAHPQLNIAGAAISKRDRQLIDTLTSRNPTLFQNLANEIGSKDLLFDAVLLYAWKGDMKEAYTILVSLTEAANPEAAMLISYDAGRYESVRSYFAGIPQAERRPSDALLADDVLVHEKEYDKAAATYRAFVRAHPNVSWTPYVDLAWLAETGKSSVVSASTAYKLLQKASALFPNQRQVVLSLASLDRSGGNTEAAHSLLSRFLKTSPWDLDANLLEMQISGATENSARVSSRLWELFYRADPADKARIARYLAWYLLGTNDKQGLALIFEQTNGNTAGEWLPFFRGIYEALLGKYSRSVKEFREADAIRPRWQTLYNLGIVEMKAGEAKGAFTDLQKAVSLLSGNHPAAAGSSDRASLHVALAGALERLGNIPAAKRELLYAQSIDPNNLSAALLLKKLDSSGQK